MNDSSINIKTNNLRNFNKAAELYRSKQNKNKTFTTTSLKKQQQQQSYISSKSYKLYTFET